ncbi:MAG: hypothetical protein KGI54_17955 [Pseudomonadota bacterium]|nr:hypothetical protein [Pseudomonadota bacterium]
MTIAILKYLLFIPLNLFVAVFGRILNPIVVLFANNAGQLPGWLSWFSTLDFSLDGDPGWQTEHRPFKNESSRFQRYINRVAWLMRNSTQGFAVNVMGAGKLGYIKSYKVYGDPLVGNRSLHNGWLFVTLKNMGYQYFEFYYVRAWSKKYCLRIQLGWKITANPQVGDTPMYTFQFWPFMGYSQ